jgi:hypothetical protein
VLEFDIRSLTEVFPYNERTSARLKDKKLVYGTSSDEPINPCVCVFENEKKQPVYFVLDCDEQSAKIFKFFNPSAVDRAIYDRLK